MTKLSFLLRLHEKLADLPQKDVEERLSFYSEMIEDRMEEGLSEAEAVAAVGGVDEIAAQVAAELSAELPVAVPTAVPTAPKRRFKTWEIVLLAIGSPIWLALGVAAVAVIFSLYAALWAVLIALWAVFGALIGCTVGGVLVCARLAVQGFGVTALAMAGAALVCGGLAILFFFGCKAATKGAAFLTKLPVLWLKKGGAR